MSLLRWIYKSHHVLVPLIVVVVVVAVAPFSSHPHAAVYLCLRFAERQTRRSLDYLGRKLEATTTQGARRTRLPRETSDSKLRTTASPWQFVLVLVQRIRCPPNARR